MKRFLGMLFALAMVLSFVGCSNLTPSQHYSIDYATYVGADVALTVAVDNGKIPAAAVPQIKTDLGVAAADLAAGKAWIVANPNLANTVGVYPDQFTLMHSAIQILVEYVAKYSLLTPIPPVGAKPPK